MLRRKLMLSTLCSPLLALVGKSVPAHFTPKPLMVVCSVYFGSSAGHEIARSRPIPVKSGGSWSAVWTPTAAGSYTIGAQDI